MGLAVVGGFTFITQRARVIEDVDSRLIDQVEVLQYVADPSSAQRRPSDPATATEDLAPDQFDSVAAYLQAVVARLVPARNEASLAVIDGEPRWVPSTLSGFDISQNTELIRRAVRESEDEGGVVHGTAVTDQGSLRYIAIPVQMSGDPESGLYIRAIDLDAELAPLTASMITYALAAGGMIVMIGLVGWFVTGRMLSPIRHLRDAADSITISDLGARIHAPGNDDISEVTRTVNSMLDRLEGSVDVQRQLLDDVRHELKTPITIVRGHLEMMDPGDAADVATTREIGMSELDRMTRLVDDIDTLASVDSGEQFPTVDVDVALLTARLGDLVAVIPEHDWSVENTGAGVVPGDPDRLLQAWLALADNAAKYTASGLPIEIGSSMDDVAAHLWVRDHGPGIPHGSRYRIFQRFDRAHSKRSVGGSGLGLAIVDAIAKAHGGTCTVADTPGGGATFTIEIPITRPADLPAPVRAGDVVLQREAAG